MNPPRWRKSRSPNGFDLLGSFAIRRGSVFSTVDWQREREREIATKDCFILLLGNRRKTSKRAPNPSADSCVSASSPHESAPCDGTSSPVSVLSIQDPHDLRMVFEKFDVNGDGQISMEELETMVRGLGFEGPREEAESMMREADIDGDGFISLEEFLHMNTQETDSSKCMEDLQNAFTIFDRDNNGLISAEELLQVLRSLGEKTTLSACKQMIRGVDTNGDGAVNFEEFMRMMTKSPA